MDLVELKKQIEKQKARITFILIILALLIPSFMVQLSGLKESASVAGVLAAISFLLIRRRRLNHKLHHVK